MLRTLSLSLFALFLATPFAVAQDASFVGDWSGNLATGEGDIEVIFHITEDTEGLSTTLDVPQQGAAGFPATSTLTEGGTLSIEFTDIQVNVTGTHADDGTIDATWAQAGQELPLTLRPVEGEAEGEASPEKREMPAEEAAPEAPENN